MDIKHPWDIALPEEEAALWFLGQAGYYLKAGACSVVIDPYLSDSAGKKTPEFTRIYPPPIDPAVFRADVFMVTHDHLDHLDPDTIAAYAHRETTRFVSPRHAARRLLSLGVPSDKVTVVDHGDTARLPGVTVEGVFALATGADVLDTTGYLLTFDNGKSVYHTSDTAFCPLLLQACPKADVLLTCINGKFGNLNIAQAVELTQVVEPRYVVPNHYDVMAMNSENPESFRYSCKEAGVIAQCVTLGALEALHW